MFTIKHPTIEDVPDIQEVFYRTWLATYPNEEVGITLADIEEKYKDRYSEEAINKRKNDILHPSPDSFFLVAKEDNLVVGVCRSRKENDYNELTAIYVLPDYQQKGIGRMLWEKTLEFLGDQKDIIVHVAAYNQPAINFYQRIGFVDSGKRMAEKHKMPISGVYIPEIELVIKAKGK